MKLISVNLLTTKVVFALVLCGYLISLFIVEYSLLHWVSALISVLFTLYIAVEADNEEEYENKVFKV